MSAFDNIISFITLLIACAISGYFDVTYNLSTLYELLIVAVSYFSLFYLMISLKYKYVKVSTSENH